MMQLRTPEYTEEGKGDIQDRGTPSRSETPVTELMVMPFTKRRKTWKEGCHVSLEGYQGTKNSV